MTSRLVLGPLADEVLLSSARVLPRRLLAAGFSFRDAELYAALRRLLQIEPAAPRDPESNRR